MKIVQMKTKAAKPKRPKATQNQKRQREMSWALYVTEGYVANMKHLAAVNCATMNPDDLKIIQMAIRQVENVSRALRVSMQNTDTVDPKERRALVEWVMKQAERLRPVFATH